MPTEPLSVCLCVTGTNYCVVVVVVVATDFVTAWEFSLWGSLLRVSDHRLEYISRLSRLSHLLFSDPNLPSTALCMACMAVELAPLIAQWT